MDLFVGLFALHSLLDVVGDGDPRFSFRCGIHQLIWPLTPSSVHSTPENMLYVFNLCPFSSGTCSINLTLEKSWNLDFLFRNHSGGNMAKQQKPVGFV